MIIEFLLRGENSNSLSTNLSLLELNAKHSIHSKGYFSGKRLSPETSFSCAHRVRTCSNVANERVYVNGNIQDD